MINQFFFLMLHALSHPTKLTASEKIPTSQTLRIRSFVIFSLTGYD